jgi:hypothetical protein
VKLAEAEGAAAQEKAVKERTALVDALEALLPDFKQVCGDSVQVGPATNCVMLKSSSPQNSSRSAATLGPAAIRAASAGPRDRTRPMLHQSKTLLSIRRPPYMTLSGLFVRSSRN